MSQRSEHRLVQWYRCYLQVRLTSRQGIVRRRKNDSRQQDVVAMIERLESRALLSAASVPSSLQAVPTIEAIHTLASSGPTGYSPAQLQKAYGFNLLSLTSGSNGTGQTIAIVDAYDAPTIRGDLQAFDRAFGLPDPPSLTIMSQTGSTTRLPGTDPSSNKQSNWEVEEALDVEWAHALAPGAKIVLVEANSASYSDLMTAVTTAANLPGVSVVSMSWGGGEFASETAYDSIFTTPSGHQGITFVASSGDGGQPGGFPAYSPNVLAVGGTKLTIGSSGNYVSESAWSLSGGGISTVEAQPSYQRGVVTQTTTKRAIPDVAFDADPNSGVAIYDSFSFGSSTPWATIGGTSLSAPAWAAVISIADQARAQNGLGMLDGRSQTLPMLYQLEQSNPGAFHDITTGNNGFAARTGYDLVTGLGTPVVNVLVPAMAGTSSGISKLAFTQSPSTVVAGQTLSTITVAIENAQGQVVTNDNSTVTLSINSGPGGFASGSRLTASAVNGIATFSNLALNVAGSYTLAATDGSLISATSPTLTVSAAAASKLVFQQTISAGTVDRVLSPAVTVAVEDQFGNVVSGNNSTVTISVASGPSGFTSSSTTAVNAANGIAVFNNLVLPTAGTYVLSASDGTLTRGSSNSFSITGSVLGTPVLSGKILSLSSIQLTWTAASGAAGYNVYYSDGTNRYYLGSVSSTTTSVQVSRLSSRVTYQFQIEAWQGTNVSESNWLSVNTGANQVRSLGAGALVHPQFTIGWWQNYRSMFW